MMFSKTKIIFVIVSVFLISTAAGLWFMFSHVLLIGENIELKAQQISDSLAQEHKFNELIDLTKDTELERIELESFILKESDTISFLAEIEEVGREQGVNFEIKSLNESESDGIFKDIRLSIGIEGTEEQLFKMLKLLESLPYYSEVESYSFSSDKEGNGSVASLVLRIGLMKDV